MSPLICPVTDFRSSPSGNREYIVIKYRRLFSLWSYQSQILISGQAFLAKHEPFITCFNLTFHSGLYKDCHQMLSIRMHWLFRFTFNWMCLQSQQKGTVVKHWKRVVNPAGQKYPTEREMYCHKEIKDAHNLLSAARYTHHGLVL